MAHLQLVRDDEPAGEPGNRKEKVDKVAGDSELAAAAGDGLGEDLEMSGEQQVLIPACRVKFNGMAWDSLDEVPALKDEMVFVVKARIIGHGTQLMKDGEIREFATAECLKVAVFEGEFPEPAKQ